MHSHTTTVNKKKSLVRTLAYYAGFIGLGLTTASLGPTLPGLAANTNSAIGAISFLFVVRSLGYLLGSLNGGRIFDRRPGNPVMGFALALSAVLLFLVPVFSSIWILSIAIFLIGVAEGTVDVGGNTLLVWTHGDKVAPFMNGLHFAFGIGALIAPIVVAQAIGMTGTIRIAYWVLSILILPIAFWLYRTSSPSVQETAKNTPQKNAVPGLLILLVVFFFLYVGAEASYAGWAYTYAISTGLGTETSAAYITSLFWGALTVGRLVAIPLASRMRPGAILTINLVGCIASMLLINLLSTSTTALWIGTIGIGFFMASIFPTLINLAQQKMTITGKITSYFFVGASSGGMFLPWIIGQFFEPVGPQFAMIAILICLCVAAIIFMCITRTGATPSPAPKEVEIDSLNV